MRQTLLFLLFLPFIPKDASSQIYTIPHATVQPAWVSPLKFIDADNDTAILYYGYDESSSILINEVSFGESIQDPVGTTFSACFGVCQDVWWNTDVRPFMNGRASVVNLDNFANPVRVIFDGQTFRSDSLPPFTTDEKPKYKLLLNYQGEVLNCSIPYPDREVLVALTDSVNDVLICSAVDTLLAVFESDLTLLFLPWDSLPSPVGWTIVDPSVCAPSVQWHPDSRIIMTHCVNNFSYTIYNLSGRAIVRGYVEGEYETEIDLPSLSNQPYVIVTHSSLGLWTKKIAFTR